MPNCPRRLRASKNEKREQKEQVQEALPAEAALLDATPSTLIKFIRESTTKLDVCDDPLPVLRGIINNCPQERLTGDEARNFEEAAIDAVFKLSRVLLDLITTKRGPVAQVAALALFNIIPAVVGVKKSVQFLISSSSALSNMYTKHWSNGMIHWGKAPNYENLDENTDCFARLQRMHYLMRILNCRKDMLEQQTNMLREQLKKHQMYVAGPSRARSKRRYHKRQMVSAEDFHEFKSSLKKDSDDLGDCFSKLNLEMAVGRCRNEANNSSSSSYPPCSGVKIPDDGYSVNFKMVQSPEILLEIFKSTFEDPYTVIRKEFNWHEENVVGQRYWHSIYLQLHLIHGAMEAPLSKEIYAESYEDWSTFSCYLTVIERALLCPASRNHTLALKTWNNWLDVSTFFVSVPMKTHNIRLADDVLNGIRRSMWILNSSFWDSQIFRKTFELHKLTKQAFANIKNRIKDPELLSYDWTEAVLRELPWKNKRKLHMLAKMIPHWQDLDIKKIIKKKSGFISFASYLSEALEFNELRAACSDVFKACLERLCEDQFVREFVPVIEASLANKKHHMGLVNYWLPALARKYPEVSKSLQVQDIHARMAHLVVLMKVQVLSLKDLLALVDENGEIFIKSALQSDDVVTRTRAMVALLGTPNFLAQQSENREILKSVLVLLKEFLRDNITVASRPSRNVFMGLFQVFFSYLRDLMLQAMKASKEIQFKQAKETAPIAEFMIWLRNFILVGLELGYCYQRSSTTLCLLESVLSTFAPQENNLRAKSEKLVGKLRLEGCYSFLDAEMFEAILRCVISPDDDCQVMASFILTSNYDFDKSTVSLSEVSEEALLLCSSNKFYIVAGGSILYSTVTTLLQSDTEETLRKILSRAKTEFSTLKEDLLKGAMENSPVYGCLEILSNLLRSNGKPSVSLECLTDILSLVEEVSDHFVKVLNAKSSSQEFASSFEDMDWAIEAEIDENYSLEKKTLHLSPQFQYALNCAWLNLKSCTELVSILGNKFCLLNCPDDVLWRCSVVIMSVLQKCRHKGAFEASGVVLGTFVKHTSLIGRDIHKKMLEILMSTLQLTGADAPPLSRRSAGLAVAIHKIVAFDADPDKELLHETLEVLVSPTEEPKDEERKQAGLVDDIKTRKMHVLYVLTSDASISQHVNCHLENIGQMAMYYLNADDWGVKNAAMQLYGAFVKKIVAQRKSKPSADDEFDPEHILSSEQDDADWDMMGNGLIEDLVVRSSYLVTQVLAIIRYPPSAEGQCTQIVPCVNKPDEHVICCVLGMLQRLTPGPPAMWTEEQGHLVNDVCYYCWQLLDHPSWLVRKQAGECAVALVNRSHYASTLRAIRDDLEKASRNRLHGLMMMVSRLKKKCAFFREDKRKLEALLKDIDGKITARLLVDLADGRQSASCLTYMYATIEGVQKDVLLKLLLYVAETHELMAVQNHCLVLLASELVEQTMAQHAEWLPEIIALCSSFDSLWSVLEHLLQCLLRVGVESEAVAEQLETALEFKIGLGGSRHDLLALMKPIILWKRRHAAGILAELAEESIWQRGTAQIYAVESGNNHTSILRMLKESEFVGDEFESLSLTYLAYTVIEFLAQGDVDEGSKLLVELSNLMLSCVESKNVPEIAVVGPALRVISPASWQLCSIMHQRPEMIEVGKIVLKLSHLLLLNQNNEAVKSIWPLRSTELYVCGINSSKCLRNLYELALDRLLPVEVLEEYLWSLLSIDQPYLAAVLEEDLTSPFSHVDEVELDFFEHIIGGFHSICKATDSKMTSQGVPAVEDVEKEIGFLDEILRSIRDQGKEKQTHLSVSVAKRKLCLKVFLLEKFYSQNLSDRLLCGISLKSLTKLLDI
ncbi:Hypothetical predicted protein [Cloeon dipterum]|uniref:DUF2428 domain-containing protein n=1 Tax=Cloeon dipterum TaxID=197152 RepID=A0A8S1DDD5_9INSE|nr:Hypothetical predicted protein [Cloeon dipterum]